MAAKQKTVTQGILAIGRIDGAGKHVEHSIRAEQIEGVHAESPSFDNSQRWHLVVTTKTKRKHSVIVGHYCAKSQQETVEDAVVDITDWLLKGAPDALVIFI